MNARGIVAIATTATAVLFVACGVPTDENAMTVEDADVPFGLLEPPTTTTTLPPTTTSTPVPTRPGQFCFVGGELLVTVLRDVPLTADLGEVVETLLAGPDSREVRDGLRSALTGPELIRSVALVAGVAQVDLSAGFIEATGTEQLLALGQVVCTLTAQPGVGQIGFTLDGRRAEVPRGDGSLTSDAVSRDDYASLMAPAPQSPVAE